MTIEELIALEDEKKKEQETEQAEVQEKVAKKRTSKKSEKDLAILDIKNESEGLASIETEGYFRDEEGNFLKNLEQVLHDSMIPYAEYATSASIKSST